MMVAFHFDAFYLVNIRFGNPYLDYIGNLDSVAFDPATTTIDDFAKFEEHGPFRIGDEEDMVAFMKLCLAIVLSLMAETVEGRALITKLERELDALTKALSQPGLEKLQILAQVHGEDLLGKLERLEEVHRGDFLDLAVERELYRARLRRLLGSYRLEAAF
ncbi:hypothetical protein DPSP01_012771 [Paraphaeosphaeria sporulosa]|uniref:Uncharacterized protein n=1 Tax=Paraphaeosphaeria sporulosa TaxID=1460663 RepID=A0A177BV25_9PLEO|nr:uncharacterized protein CC84DRAFT_1170056 [Paraphaeosphaeria sporulosa]OAF98508.1 hypothetical protein CC84DRAFT_1170056 [Paraphaeosphaeria sporulosa]